MKTLKMMILSFICTVFPIGTIHAEENSLSGIKLGFGFDRGFSVVGSMGNLNGFLGDDGIAADYIFMKEKLEGTAPMYWYVGGGGFVDWDGDFGARLPIGGELYFAKNLDAYAQFIPRLKYNNNSNNSDNLDLGLDFGIGVRYQF